MKTFHTVISLFIITLLLQACATSTPYAYDDVYYSPNNDPVKQVKKNPREDFNKTDNIHYDGSYQNRYNEEDKDDNYPRSLYDNRYTEAERNDNQQAGGNGETNITINNNNNNEEVEYYDEEYAETLDRINSPVRNFNSYDPYTRDRIRYTQDPFFCSPTLYGGYNWNPYTPRTSLRLGYNTWSGWNIGLGIGVGVGVGYNNWGYSAYPFYDPFYSPFYDPFWGYNRFNNPWMMGYGYGYNNYWIGYNQGFYNGINYGNYYGNNYYSGSGGESGSNTRRISRPRGNSGSTTYKRSGESAPTRESRANPNSRNKSNSENRRPTKVNSRPTERDNASSRPSRTSTPEKYKIDRSPSTYTRPEPSNRPSRTPSNTRPTTRPTTSPKPAQRPTYSRPRNNTYNRSNRVQPQRNQPAARPQRQGSPSYNNNRPTFNNTPTYGSPSRGGGSSTPSSRPSRGGRPRR